MRLFKSLAAAASIAMIASPIAASADPAGSLSLVRAATDAEGNDQIAESIVLKVAIVAAAAGMTYVFLDGVGAFDGDDDDGDNGPDLPASP